MSFLPCRPVVRSPTFIVFTVALSIGAWWLATVFAAPRSPRPVEVVPAPPAHYEVAGLVVEAAALELGEVWEDGHFRHRFSVRNRTGADLRVAEFQGGCSCLAVEPRELLIPAGGTAEVQLTIDLTQRAPWERHLDRRPLGITIRPILDKTRPPAEAWVLRGTVRSRVTLDTDFVHFGDRAVSGVKSEPRRLTAIVHVPAKGLDVLVRSATSGTASAEPIPGRAGAYTVRVTPSASLAPGPFRFDLDFRVTDDEGAQQFAGIILPVAGTMAPRVRAIPSQVVFGPKPVGATAEATVILQVPSGAAWAVDRIEIDSPDVRIERATVKGQPEGRAFRVTQKITKEDDQSSVVRFLVRKGEGEPTPLAMTVSYYGQPAQESKP